MANVEHSTLTGSDLHEPKGVAAAVANRVYLSNGAGSGSWSTVPAAAIDAAGIKVFQSQMLHVRDETPSGSASQGNMTFGSWVQRRLQTKVNDDITATLTGNQIVLPAGTYILRGYSIVRAYNYGFGSTDSAKAKIRLRNLTASTTLVNGSGLSVGSGTFTAGDGDVQVPLMIDGKFTVAAAQTLELQCWCTFVGSLTNVDAGLAMSSGENEIYSDLMFWKLS